MKIEKYSFGSITINGKEYTKDVIIFPDKVLSPWWREEGHSLSLKDLKDVIESAPNLLIIGTGLEEEKLKKMALENIKFTGYVSDKEKDRLIANSKGFINPVENEDFGIIPIEAMSLGVPVLVHKSGGHLESVKEGVNGMFFESLDVENLTNTIKEFNQKIEQGEFKKGKVKESVQKFSAERFKNGFSAFIWRAWEEHARTTRDSHNRS